MWIVVLPLAPLYMVVFLPQQYSPPLHQFALSMFPQSVAPQLRLPPILQ